MHQPEQLSIILPWFHPEPRKGNTMKVKPNRQQRVTHEAKRRQTLSAKASRGEMSTRNGPDNDWGLPPASIPSDLPWNDNLRAFPQHGEPGVIHQTALGPITMKGGGLVLALHVSLLFDQDGRLIGCLNHYPLGELIPAGARLAGNSVGMHAGEYSIVIRKSERNHGYGLALLAAADSQWSLDFWCQRYTIEGRALVVKYLNQQAQSTNLATQEERAKVYERLSS